MHTATDPATAIRSDARHNLVRRRDRAFTLIEFIGVLAVIAVLAAALVPVLVKQMDEQARRTEEKSLQGLRESLQKSILRNRAIPNQASYAQAIADELGCTTANVLTNDRRVRRVLLIDPAVTNTLPVPYAQGASGITNALPGLLGVVLVSSVSAPLPSTLTDGFASSPAAFANIWNTANGAIPAGWTWAGRGEDLKIERLNLSTLFVPLVLNYDTWTVTTTNRGRFTIDNSSTNALPGTATIYQSSYFKGTVVGLHSHTGTSGTLQASTVLGDPASFVYERDTWRGQLFLGRGTRQLGGLDLQSAMDLFLSSPVNSSAKGTPATLPTDVAYWMSNYMVLYINWANTGFQGNAPAALNNAQKQLETVSAYYIFKPSN